MFSESERFRTREMTEKSEEENLASCALKSSRARRLIGQAPEGRIFDYRSEYQRDRDRIIYSRAFRRLKNKARITRSADEDHGRDRLSHTIEVSQIARTIGRGLRLNEDLIEAISLGHELGVPPFGEDGKRVLDSIMRGNLMTGVAVPKRGRVGFRQNLQTLRVVDLLEKRYEHEGLNLTNDTREGIVKQGEFGKDLAYPDLRIDGLRLSSAPSFEDQVVLLADDFGTQMESLDDGLHCGEFELIEVEKLSIVRELIRKLGARYLSLKGNYMKVASLNRGLTHLLVTNIICSSSIALEKWMQKNGVDSTERFYEKRESIRGDEISLPPKVFKLFGEMKLFIAARLGHSAYSQRAGERARKVIEELFRTYCSNPLTADDYLLLRQKKLKGLRFLRDLPAARIRKEIMKHYTKDPSFIRSICDHIAGMTDSYALKEYQRIAPSSIEP